MLLLSTKISMIFNLSQMTTSQIMFISQAVLQCINKKEENPLFTLNINAQSNIQSLSVNDVLFVCAVYFSTTNEFVELPVLVQLSNSYNNIQPSVAELSKWTKMMLIEFILNKLLPSNCKAPNHISATEPVNEHLVVKSGITTAAPKFVVGSNSTASSKLTAVPVVKFWDIFVSWFHPQITASQLKTELFDGMDVSITQMITRHPTYSSFHIRVPAEKSCLSSLKKPVSFDQPTSPLTLVGDFADDKAILTTSPDPILASSYIQNYLNSLESWYKTWGVKMNETKSMHGEEEKKEPIFKI
ncbi:hypothetical protein QTP88_005037 [Uroleucon formosanum]